MTNPSCGSPWSITTTSRSMPAPPLRRRCSWRTCWTSSGWLEANRTYRNGIVFLVADTGQVDAMRETVRYHLAAQRIVSDGQRMAGYAEEVQKKLRAIADKAGIGCPGGNHPMSTSLVLPQSGQGEPPPSSP